MKVIRTPSAPIREQTVKNLREAIVNGFFKPGDRLVERKLCKLMGVSRTPLREALRQLETEGLVEIESFSGPRVATVSLDQAKDIYQIRVLLESFAFKLFAQNAAEKDIKALRSAFERIKQAVEKKEADQLVKLKDGFYEILLKRCGNQLICSMLLSLNARIAFLRRTSLSQSGRPNETVVEIEKIVEAIEKRDADAAWEASIDHLKMARENALKRLDPEHAETIYDDESISGIQVSS